MPSNPDLPIDVIPIAPGYAEEGESAILRPVVAIGRNAHREYQACGLNSEGRLEFIMRVVALPQP